MALLKSIAALPVVLLVLYQALEFAGHTHFPVPPQGSGILVTGASSGIGRHASISLARKGYNVFAGVRKEKDAASIRAEGIPTLRPVFLDVTKPEMVEAAVAEVEAKMRELGLPLKVLVNNAGVDMMEPVETLAIDDARWVMEVNFFAVIDITQRMIPILRAAGPGSRIVQLSSVAGLMAGPGWHPYASSKHALEALSEGMRVELAPWQIATVVINPAFVRTEILKKSAQHSTARPQATVEQYAHLYNPTTKYNDDTWIKLAAEPQVTTDAIEAAITSSYPKTRYICANIGGMPAWVYTSLKAALPSPLWDKLVTITLQGWLQWTMAPFLAMG